MSIIVGVQWKLSLLTDPLVSGYLFLWPPSQNPVFDIFLNSYTNSVFLNFCKRPAPVTDTFFES